MPLSSVNKAVCVLSFAVSFSVRFFFETFISIISSQLFVMDCILFSNDYSEVYYFNCIKLLWRILEDRRIAWKQHVSSSVSEFTMPAGLSFRASWPSSMPAGTDCSALVHAVTLLGRSRPATDRRLSTAIGDSLCCLAAVGVLLCGGRNVLLFLCYLFGGGCGPWWQDDGSIRV